MQEESRAKSAVLVFVPLTRCTIVHTIHFVDFEWDPKKDASNFAKHGIRFADAVSVFEDDAAITIRDPFSEHEERWVTIGVDALGRLLDVVYTWRDERIRIISAWKASNKERRQYEENQ